MTLAQQLHTLRKRWRLVVLCVLLALAAASAAVALDPPTYQADVQMFVSAKGSDDISGAAAGSQITLQRVKSYAQVVASPRVTQNVVRQLHLPLTAEALSQKVTADNPLDTVLLNVHVTDHDPVLAQKLANTVAADFIALVPKIETAPVKVSVVHDADLPTHPISPKKKLDLALGLLVGLAIGVGGAVLLENLDTSVKNTEDTLKATGAPALGIVGFDSDASAHPLIVQVDPHGQRAEAFRQLRTNLQFIDVDHPVRSIVITSSIPGEGKSTTAANLAITLSQAGLRVILIEADLRRPKLIEYLGLEGAVGLTNVLIGRVSVDDVLQPWGDGLLQVLPAGPTPPNPAELLGSQTMADTLATLESRADMVILDAPPLLPVTDAAVLTKLADGAIIIVRQGHTKKEQLTHAAEALRTVDGTLLGAVLNMAPAKGPDAYAYGYGYRYSYRPTTPAGITPSGGGRIGHDIVPTSGTPRGGRRATDSEARPPAYTGTVPRRAQAAAQPTDKAAELRDSELEEFFGTRARSATEE